MKLILAFTETPISSTLLVPPDETTDDNATIDETAQVGALGKLAMFSNVRHRFASFVLSNDSVVSFL